MGVKEKATEAGMKLMSDLMSDPEKAQRIMQALQTVQKGRETVKEMQQQVLHTVGLPTKEDVARIGRRLSKLRRRLRHLSDRVAGGA
ncbi:MAG: hypothetical protein D6729_01025 [Deltaproteobacteria bacterium]|nr:MAG: hypothetical protein D6729_01025 [Deltaproteobacteria bacterium]